MAAGGCGVPHVQDKPVATAAAGPGTRLPVLTALTAHAASSTRSSRQAGRGSRFRRSSSSCHNPSACWQCSGSRAGGGWSPHTVASLAAARPGVSHAGCRRREPLMFAAAAKQRTGDQLWYAAGRVSACFQKQACSSHKPGVCCHMVVCVMHSWRNSRAAGQGIGVVPQLFSPLLVWVPGPTCFSCSVFPPPPSFRQDGSAAGSAGGSCVSACLLFVCCAAVPYTTCTQSKLCMQQPCVVEIELQPDVAPLPCVHVFVCVCVCQSCVFVDEIV